MVVSEIGEQWSPQTAPAIHADIAIIIRLGSVSWNDATTIGIRIPNVPQLVPVANARNTAITNIITGRKLTNSEAEPLMIEATNSFAPKLSVIALIDHANVRIRICGIIEENHLGIHSMNYLNETTLLAI